MPIYEIKRGDSQVDVFGDDEHEALARFVNNFAIRNQETVRVRLRGSKAWRRVRTPTLAASRAWLARDAGRPRENPAEPCRPRRLYVKLKATPETFPKLPRIIDPVIAAVACKKLIGDRAYEVFVAMYLNAQNCAFAYDEFSEGGITGVTVATSTIVRNALLAGARGVITFHQHPSGTVRPSAEDQALWDKLRSMCLQMDIELLDNFVLGPEGFFSEAQGQEVAWR